MPKVRIQSTDIEYTESDVITFEEGLIGLPQLRRLVVISQPEITPFLWLASVEADETAFLVLDPQAYCDSYTPRLPGETRARIGLKTDEEPLLLAITRIMPEWHDSTLNLRAPLVISTGAMRGTQPVLTESGYRLDEPLAALAALV
ncbi:MAG: flagellar assembly protein FliW [Acidobacteria bacterium]|nr:flagellar assembly protein FliW [Acidobacteriota bacterium]MBI3425659.1 flagellar assembly protein FliW [Acidobacteriota bacterium]